MGLRLAGVPKLPILTEDALDDQQRVVWDLVTLGQRGDSMRVIDAAGGLAGPFNAMLHAPEVGQHVLATGEALRFHSALPRRLIELVTVTVAAHWRSEFEWAVHAPIAAQCGVPAEVLEAIARDEQFVTDDRGEAVAVEIARQLLADGRLAPETGAEALDLHGPRAFVELVTLVGYYCSIAFVLAAFDVVLPDGAAPVWIGDPR